MDPSCNSHRLTFLTDTRSRAHFSPSLPHINSPCIFCITALLVFYVQPEDGHYQAPKHVVVPYVENILYCTNKYSCVRRVHTLYIRYFFVISMVGRRGSVGTVTCCWLDASGFDSRWRRDFPQPSSPALEPTQLPVQWVSCLLTGRKSAWTWSWAPTPI